MDTPLAEERKSNRISASWRFSNSIHSSIMTEDLLPPRKLNAAHYICIGIFLGFSSCTVAATIYAFAT